MKSSIQDTKQFGAAVRRARRFQELTQQELALTANTASRFISDLENGKPTCQIGKALHVARCLGMDLELEDHL